MIYLDNSATTPVLPEVRNVMADVLEKHYGNPSSLHKKGLEAEKILSMSRKIIAETLGASDEEIIFTTGGTEGNNLALKGIAFGYSQRGKHIITSKIEHPAVLECCRQLEAFGFEITYLNVDNKGLVCLQELEESIREDTLIVSIMHVNNEVGAVQPIQEIGEILKKHPKVFFHVDAVQGFNKLPIHINKWNVDLLTISGHKICGPKGSGALFVKKGTALVPLLAGGGQEYGLRSGTENVAAIVGFAKACKITREIYVNNIENMQKIRKECIRMLREKIPKAVINGPKENEVSPYILNISIPGLKGEVLLHALEREGVLVSTGSACSSKNDITSPILDAMGIAKDIKLGSIRASFSYETSLSDIDRFIESLTKIVVKMEKR